VRVWMRARACVCMCARVCVSVCACVRFFLSKNVSNEIESVEEPKLFSANAIGQPRMSTFQQLSSLQPSVNITETVNITTTVSTNDW
jgi:hypothetical protein